VAITRVEIKDFLVFKGGFAADLCSGVNVFIGENGTGKTTLLRILYRHHANTRPLNDYDKDNVFLIYDKEKITIMSDFTKKEGVITHELFIRGCKKKSETRYKVLKSQAAAQQATAAPPLENGFSVLEIELGTGRMHQIRRHLAMIGNPVLGDDKYGDFALNKKLQKTLGLKRLLLHASRLVINNLDIQAPLPLYFQDFIS